MKKKFKVIAECVTQYEIEIEAEDKDYAHDKALDLSGDIDAWKETDISNWEIKKVNEVKL